MTPAERRASEYNESSPESKLQSLVAFREMDGRGRILAEAESEFLLSEAESDSQAASMRRTREAKNELASDMKTVADLCGWSKHKVTHLGAANLRTNIEKSIGASTATD